ncbi:MAG: phosphatase PAP2 family protein [bacterium]|nr:phosphatase PAP2 family protein [bacterium]
MPDKSSSEKPREEKPYLEEIRPKKIWDDISHVITFPARMDLTGSLILAGVLGATGIFMSQDENIRGRIREIPDNDGINAAAKAGKWLGDGRLIVPLFLVSGAGGYLGKNQRLVRISVETLETLALSGLTVQILKFSTGRSRPFRDSGSWDFTGPSVSNEAFHSFPSGHAVTIGSVAGVLAGEFESIWIDLAAGGLVGLTAFQRMYADRHWASDVFFGSAIGIATGYSIARHRKAITAARILVTSVSLQSAQPGIQFTYIF